VQIQWKERCTHAGGTQPDLASRNSTGFVEQTDDLLLQDDFGTAEREKNAPLLPKRHQIKHLEFLLS
jgi:hypothetical protein